MPVSAQLIPVGTWKADPVHSSAAFAVEHLGVSNFRASFGGASPPSVVKAG